MTIDDGIFKRNKQKKMKKLKPQPLRCANCLELINEHQPYMKFIICQNCYQLDRDLNEALKELYKKGNQKINDAVEKNKK